MKSKMLCIVSVLMLSVAFSLVPAIPAEATTAFTVDDGWQIGVPPYAEDTDADTDFATIQAAIDQALSGDSINVLAGTYKERITLKNGVRVLGAGVSVATIDGGKSGTVVTATGVTSATVLDGFTITNGKGTSGSTGKSAGGMYNINSSPTVTDCIFSGNSADDYGGGMYNYQSSSPVVMNCTFSSNFGSEGGGIYNDVLSSPTVTKCVFSGNSGSDGGGIGNADNSSPMVINCIFSGNSVDTYGGGMDNFENCSPMVTNCSFSGNSAKYGGGMDNYTNCSPILSNCIFWGDVPDEINNIKTSVPVVTYCDIQGGYDGNNINIDPMFIDPVNGNLHLQSGSPCIDTGTNTGAPSYDIEGNPRPIDGNNDGTAITDMGAYEYHTNHRPQGVGGEVCSVSKLGVVFPWLAIALLVIGSGVGLRFSRRKTS